ncbi:hypothetical protein ADJ77_05940 [Prevotella fusca JCM 17724]|uniref:Uncharacterized protein n=1 Tax=Prevotella fusca JCM 17724 TaxID=1236517 RepID=A0A0K1NJQ8_9BACT|nr:hypothetical protein ADJ77_05940 [Prevotella fusca JCM 17724]
MTVIYGGKLQERRQKCRYLTFIKPLIVMKATHKTALQSALLLCQKDICHELSSRKKRIIFMKKNIFLHEKK